MSSSITRLNYCQFLLSSQINYTLTYFADHSEQRSHDAINRYLQGDRITPNLIWDNVKGQIVLSPNGYLISDDTVSDKRHSYHIGLVRRQYSGNAKAVIKGIGVVTCIYVNPDTDQFRIADFRIYDPEGDGKSELHHVRDMLENAVFHRQLPIRAVLMDSWYAVKWLILYIESSGKLYCCPIRSNRLINETGHKNDYHRADTLLWTCNEQIYGKTVHLRGFPKGHQMKLFRMPLSTERTDYVVTDDLSQFTIEAVQEASGFRRRIEQFHRESKQLTGMEFCQCRKKRIQRNHIGCAMLVWVRLKQLAYQAKQTVCHIKQNLLSDYMIQQLRNPMVKMTLA